MSQPDPAGLKIRPLLIRVRPGLTGTNVAAVLFGSFSTIALIVIMGLLQPYILNEILHTPTEAQGGVTGRLALLQEIITIALVGFMGAWSDRVGRRRVYVLGLTMLGLGYFVYPLATTETQLILFRCVFAVGAAAAPVMLSTTIQDTPQEASRGKWVGLNLVCQGFGVLILATALLAQAPKWYVDMGFDPVTAGRYAYWSATGLCIVAAVILSAGLERSSNKQASTLSITRQLGQGLQAGMENPRLALAYGAAFIGRGDLVVVGSFLTLWVTQHGIDTGLSTAQSVAKAGMLFGMVQLAAIGWAFFMGMIADRINRVTGLCIALAAASVGYTLMGMVEDPFGDTMIPIAFLLGIGEISVIVAGGALLGQEAGTRRRGAIVGSFNLVGGIGIMFGGYVGGLVFDGIGRTAPFIMMGISNGLLLLLGLAVWRKARWK